MGRESHADGADLARRQCPRPTAGADLEAGHGGAVDVHRVDAAGAVDDPDAVDLQVRATAVGDREAEGPGRAAQTEVGEAHVGPAEGDLGTGRYRDRPRGGRYGGAEHGKREETPPLCDRPHPASPFIIWGESNAREPISR